MGRLLTNVAGLILVAGIINAATEITIDEGDEYIFNVIAFPYSISSCHLTGPDGQPKEFVPDQKSTHEERFELQPIGTLAACSIVVRNLVASDSGVWTVAAVSNGEEVAQDSYRLIVMSDAVEGGSEIESEEGIHHFQTHHITRNQSWTFGECAAQNGGYHNHCISGFKEDIHEHWLPPIEHYSRTGQYIDVSLSKIDHPEDCYVVTPGGERLKVSELSVTGLTAHRSSAFVSCRITIGPMEKGLLGKWSLCGKHTTDSGEVERCQQATITWNDNNNPGTDWHKTVQETYNHPVNLGGILTPVVLGIGDIVACHIITPNGEDLIITHDTDYPHLKRANSSDCSIAIGPIQENMLGNWTIYGQFNNFIFGLHEEHLPVNLFLYDEQNPYDQAYNVTVLDPVIHDVKLGNTLNLVITGSGLVNDCQFKPPSGQEYDLISQNFEGATLIKNDAAVACQLTVGPIVTELLGTWEIIGKFNNNGVFIERKQRIKIIEEDPENPIGHDREIEYLNKKHFESEIGLNHTVIIASNIFHNPESCHIRTPNGLQYKIKEGFDVPGVKEITGSDIECGVNIAVLSKEFVGEWTLMARATRHSVLIEQRLPFTINVEVSTANTITLNLVRDSSVEDFVGPEDVVYCKLEDPTGFTVFEGFGRCKLSLDIVTLDHQGTWKMFVGLTGRVLVEEHQLLVHVVESESKPVITTHVEKINPEVIVSCSIVTSAPILGCKFRDPQGNILLANGNSEDRYVFFGTDSTQSSGHTCGINLTTTQVSDLGIWRCAIDTEEDTYYAFMDVLCPWALQDPTVAATVQQEPILSADRAVVAAVEENPVTLSCSVDAAIRYCYFRAANGTIFTVSPAKHSSAMEYVGAGFEAGECGVKFHSMRHTDSGRWSCHVGLHGNQEEQREQLQLTVEERMSASHHTIHGGIMMVEGKVHGGRALEYCRFVRIDGFGFTSENIPEQYTFTGLLANGECLLRIANPTILDMHPWTIVAKIRGQDVEISRDTMHSIVIAPEEEKEESIVPEVPQVIIQPGRSGVNTFILVVLCLTATGVIIGAIFSRKTSRQWASQRASNLRSSFNGSLWKKPSPPQYPSNTTAQSA